MNKNKNSKLVIENTFPIENTSNSLTVIFIPSIKKMRLILILFVAIILTVAAIITGILFLSFRQFIRSNPYNQILKLNHVTNNNQVHLMAKLSCVL